MNKYHIASLAGLLSLLGACQQLAPAPKNPDPGVNSLFLNYVGPILEKRCIVCHDGNDVARGLDFRSAKALTHQTSFGPLIVPGDPFNSALLTVIGDANEEPVPAMPPTGHELKPHELQAFGWWIVEGAVWPKGRAGQLRQKGGVEEWRSW